MAKKRSNGEGSISKRSNGSWRGQLMDGYKPDGSPNRINFSGKTKSEVLNKMREYQRRKNDLLLLDKRDFVKFYKGSIDDVTNKINESIVKGPYEVKMISMSSASNISDDICVAVVFKILVPPTKTMF